MNNLPEGFHTEDAFISDSDGWITLPGEGGKVSPEGIVYDSNGEPLYTLYEDSEAPINAYFEEMEDEFEWID